VKPPIDPVTPPVGATESCARSEEERKALGLSPNLYTAFCTSGKSPEAFAADRRLRGGSVGFELSAGAPIQWFERNYDVAYGVGSNGDVSSPHLIDSLVATGMSVDGGTPTVLTRAALSFHPGHAVELGLAGGLSLNQRGTAQSWPSPPQTVATRATAPRSPSADPPATSSPSCASTPSPAASLSPTCRAR
jgi:hypothetical protein